jgi:hypothetical protein
MSQMISKKGGGNLRRISLSIGLGLLLATQAFAQYSGQLSSAITTPSGHSRIGVYTGIYDGAIGILGQYRYGIDKYADIGFKLGVVDFDHTVEGFGVNEAGADFAFDFKYRILESQLRDPFDLSAGGALEFVTVDVIDIFSLGVNVVGSYPVKLRNGRLLEPYGRLIMRVQHESPEGGNSNTDLEIGLNMGTSFELSRTVRAFGELQFDDPFAFYLGVDFDL